jgi:Tol biopolymer transport system component
MMCLEAFAMTGQGLFLKVVFVAVIHALGCATVFAEDERAAALADEVKGKGWLVYGARSDNGTWDLFLSRPDGSQRRNITDTADFEEAAPRWSPDSTKMLYRRMAKGAVIDHDRWGFQGELIVADADGRNAVALGGEGEFPWASWSPNGKQLACLTKKGIQIVDLASKETVRSLPRKGIYQQLFWSPDGTWFCGTANHGGESWTVVRMNAETGEVKALRKFQNCTPDWYPDSKRIILSSRPANQPGNDGYGYTQLWKVDLDGTGQALLYGEDGYHIYGGALSPDGEYILFTKSSKDGAGSEKAGAPICVMRASDAPSIGGESADLRKLHPNTKDGPSLTLDTGWEPCWTYADVGEAR